MRDVSDDGDDVAVKIPLVNLFQGTPIHCYANMPNQDRAKGEVCVLGVVCMGLVVGWGGGRHEAQAPSNQVKNYIQT